MSTEAAAALPSTRVQSLLDRAYLWRDRLLASRRFHRWAARFPLTRPIARRRAGALFDLCAGYVYAQVLAACVELRVFPILAEGPLSTADLSNRLALPRDSTERLMAAAVSLGLLERRGPGRFGLGVLGAASLGNPGIAAMVEHGATATSPIRWRCCDAGAAARRISPASGPMRRPGRTRRPIPSGAIRG